MKATGEHPKPKPKPKASLDPRDQPRPQIIVQYQTELTHSSCLTEHVVRPTSEDSNQTVTRPRRSSSVITNPYADFEPPPNDSFFLRNTRHVTRNGKTSRFSPTPSVRRGKVAALLREHASPPGVRVTAGGRLVPDGTSPLTSPKSENPSKYDGYPKVPNLVPGTVTSHQALAYEGMIVNTGGNQICQIVNGQFVHVGFTNSPLNLLVPPTNPIIPSSNRTASSAFTAAAGFPNSNACVDMSSHSSGGVAAPPDQGSRKTWEKLENELKATRRELDRDEVLTTQKGAMTPLLRAQIREHRMSLTTQISHAHDMLKAMDEYKNQDSTPLQPAILQHGNPSVPPSHHYPAHVLNPAAIPPHFPPPVFDYYSNPSGMASYMDGLLQNQYPAYPSSTPNSGVTWYSRSNQGQAISAYGAAQERPPITGELAERVENLRLASDTFNHGNDSKLLPKGSENAGMNLDGSGPQPRRSHAVAIRKPLNESEAHRSRLNPTSAVYEPAQPCSLTVHSNNSDEEDKLASSSKQEVEREKLLHSPKRLTRTDPGPSGGLFLDSSLDGHRDHGRDSFQTGGSADTLEFFPTDFLDHSARSFTVSDDKMQKAANPPEWTSTKENDSDLKNVHLTPVRSTNNFGFNKNDSPVETTSQHKGSASAKLFSNDRTTSGGDVTAKPPLLHLSSSNWRSLENKKEQLDAIGGESANTSFNSTSHCENTLAQKQSTPTDEALDKTELYWSGFSHGLASGLVPSNEDDCYRRGYRDGLLRSVTQTAPLKSPSFDLRCKSSFDRDLVPPSRRSSFPIFQAPRVPSNTAANSPLRQSWDHENTQAQISPSSNKTPVTSKSVESPSADSAQRGIGTQTSFTNIRLPEPTSPLAERSLRNLLRQPNSGTKRESSTPRIFSGSGLDNPRYPRKVQTSVAPSSKQARGVIPHQFDGSAEDEEFGLLRKPQEGFGTSSPPVQVAKGKEKVSAPTSPIKRASSAVHKLTQIGVMSKRGSTIAPEDAVDTAPLSSKAKKEQDPAKMNSSEKAKWRNRWRKRFEDMKNDEQSEISEYRRTHPAS